MSKQEPSAKSVSEIPGFENVDLGNVNESTLTSEDLESRKKQLWLIKVPYEFDVSKLSGTSMVLNGSQDLPVRETNDKRYESRSSKYKKDESCHFKMVVPSKTKGCLNVAKNFVGHMDIIQTVKVPALNYPPAPPPMYTDIPKGLKTRWKPFGHRTPAKLNDQTIVKEAKNVKVEKKRKLADVEEMVSHKSPKKKKKKKESGYGSSLQLDDSSNSTKHKKKKKKKKDS